MDDDRVDQLFNACDLDGSGYIDQQELSAICTDLTNGELTDVFKELDRDGDGRISVEEFAKGFREISGALLSISREKRKERLQSLTSENQSEDYVCSLDEGLKTLSCQEQVVELYQQLHASDEPELLASFESIIIGVIRDVRSLSLENDRLEVSFKREKETFERHLRDLEDETEAQMIKTEKRIRKKEQEKAEVEKNELKKQLDEQMLSMHETLKKMQQDRFNDAEKQSEEQVPLLRSKVEELIYDNRTLKNDTMDAQTNLALVRSELATMKQQYKERCHELDLEKETVMDYIREQDNLTRQLHQLHDANKNLHDTNDDLCSALDTSRSSVSHKRSHSTDSPTYSPRMLPGIQNVHQSSNCGSLLMSPNASLAEEVSMIEHMSSTGSVLIQSRSLRLPHRESFEEDSVDLDSGHSTMRDPNEIDTESDCLSIEEARHHKRLRPDFDFLEEPESYDEMDTEVEVQVDTADASMFRKTTRNKRHLGPRRSLSRTESNMSVSSHGSQRSTRRTLPMIPQEIAPRIHKDPERMYKVVLAGDAAVGKSSFIMRLCKGKFVNNLSSTLGVDFQTKVLEVDGRTIALQLWDTAGQERFRSIAKSYFRRADGVLLLYDCSYERSFMNVRDWLEAIEDGAQKKIPIMLCGNKCDLRDDMKKEGRRVVRTEDGQRLAKEVDALFIETSAKEGDNITESVLELTRILRTNEDLEVKSAGLQLHELKNGKKNGFCCG